MVEAETWETQKRNQKKGGCDLKQMAPPRFPKFQQDATRPDKKKEKN